MRVTKLALITAALAAGPLLLTGCEPSNTAGNPSAAGGVTCDANGWGPLSGCDSTDSSEPTPTEADPAPCETTDSSPDQDSPDHDSSDHDTHGVNDTEDSSGPGGTDENGCAIDSPPKFGYETQTEDQKTTEAPEKGFTVTVTWIVVRIDVTGFRECVISLREAAADSDGHLSRRITTPEDCEAQRVDTVYRPVGE